MWRPVEIDYTLDGTWLEVEKPSFLRKVKDSIFLPEVKLSSISDVLDISDAKETDAPYAVHPNDSQGCVHVLGWRAHKKDYEYYYVYVHDERYYAFLQKKETDPKKSEKARNLIEKIEKALLNLENSEIEIRKQWAKNDAEGLDENLGLLVSELAKTCSKMTPRLYFLDFKASVDRILTRIDHLKACVPRPPDIKIDGIKIPQDVYGTDLMLARGKLSDYERKLEKRRDEKLECARLRYTIREAGSYESSQSDVFRDARGPRFPANDGWQHAWQEAQRKAWERDRDRRMGRR
jgi:hypothetical protein